MTLLLWAWHNQQNSPGICWIALCIIPTLLWLLCPVCRRTTIQWPLIFFIPGSSQSCQSLFARVGRHTPPQCCSQDLGSLACVDVLRIDQTLSVLPCVSPKTHENSIPDHWWHFSLISSGMHGHSMFRFRFNWKLYCWMLCLLISFFMVIMNNHI